MDKSTWEKEYPRMPRDFHLAVIETVKKNIEEVPEKQPPTKPHRKPAKRKLFILSLAAVLLFGSLTTIAKVKEEKFNLGKYLDIKDYESVSSIFQTDIEERVEETVTLPEYIDMDWVSTWKKREDNSPLLDIQQLMYDGSKLCIYAVPTENGKKYETASNRLYIGGERVGPVDEWDNEGKRDFYIYIADMRELGLKPPFEVTLPLSVYGKWGERYENQDLTFTVNTDIAVDTIKDQEFVFDNYTVKVTDMKKSAVTFWGKVKVERTKEQQAAYEEENRIIVSILFKSKDGTVWPKQPLTDQEGAESGIEKNQWYFSREIPSRDEQSVMLYLVAGEKGKMEEKFDISDKNHQYGEGMEIMLE